MDQKHVPGLSLPKQSEVILVVEEDDTLRDFAHMILVEGGYTVLDARDGREGLALCAGHQGPIDLLVADLTIADLNAHELAERAIRLRPDLKVMFMFGHEKDLALIESVPKGRVLLQKPFTPVGLVEKVREALEGKEGRG